MRDRNDADTTPTQRRHNEILGRLDALIDAMTPADKQPVPEPADVTEEPPIGSQVTDEDGDIWERFRGGWSAWDAVDRYWGAGIAVDCPWDAVRECAPLRLTTDADRERVGLPVDTAPDEDEDRVQVKDEPPIGSQVTDKNGDVWERFEHGWRKDHTESPADKQPEVPPFVAQMLDGPAVFAHTRARCARCDHRRKDHDGDNGICARYDDPDCVCTGFEEPPERRVNVVIMDVFAVPDEYGYLRINVGPETAVIDQNASNIRVTDVESTPDVDPDEALAKAICRSLDFPESSMLGQAVTAAVKDVLAAGWFPDVERLTRECDEAQMERSDDGLMTSLAAVLRDPNDYEESALSRLTRVAREHINGGMDIRIVIDQREEQRDRAEKAEADVERLTRNREIDRLQINRLVRERDAAEGRAATAERERDEARANIADWSRTASNRSAEADAANARYEALRADVERGSNEGPPGAGSARSRCAQILVADDERGRR